MGGHWKPISISHCRTMVALAIAPRGYRIGIDCETDDRFPTLKKVANRFLSPEQMENWSEAPASLWAWTIKEAAYKAISNPPADMTQIPLPLEIALEETTDDATIQFAGRTYNVMQIDASGSLPAMLMMVYAEHGADDSCSPNLDNGED
jgi:4'-phosphopantetheinyl transferase EntD